MYTAERAIVRAAEKMRKASLARSVLEAQLCVLSWYWNASIVRPSSAMERRNMRPKKTLRACQSTNCI